MHTSEASWELSASPYPLPQGMRWAATTVASHSLKFKGFIVYTPKCPKIFSTVLTASHGTAIATNGFQQLRY